MPDPVVAQFRKLVAEKSSRLDLLLVLSLTGPRNINQFSDLVRAAGLRETATRVNSTVTLRRALDVLIQRGLVVQTDSEFDCARFTRELSLRDAAQRGVLDRIANAIRTPAHPYLHYSTHNSEAAWFDFRVVLQRRELHQATTLLAQCAAQNSERFIVENPLVQAVCEPFDPAWLAGFGPHRAALLAWTLDYTNRFGLPTFDMYPWVRKHVAE